MVYSAGVVATSSPGPVGLFESGPVLAAYLAGPNAVYNADGSLNVGASVALGSAVPVQAEIDTGSTVSGADQSLLVAVGAPVTLGASIPVQTPSGNATDQTYQAALWLEDGTANVWANIPGVLGEYLPSGPRVLIGRDVLAGGSLVYDGTDGGFTLTLPQAAVQPQTQPAGPTWGAGAALAGVGLVLLLLDRRRAA